MRTFILLLMLATLSPLLRAAGPDDAWQANNLSKIERVQGKIPRGDGLYAVTDRLSAPHPRLLPGGMTYAELRKRGSDPAFKAFADMVRDRAKWVMDRKPFKPEDASPNRDVMRHIANHFMHLTTAALIAPDDRARDEYVKAVEVLADDFITLGVPKGNDLHFSHTVIGFVTAYDNLYPFLSDAAKTKMRQHIVDIVRYSRDTPEWNVGAYRMTAMTSNHNWFYYAQMGLAAMALWGDPASPAAPAELKRWLDDAVLDFYLAAKVHPEDGFCMEGVMYQDYGNRAWLDFAIPAEKLLELKFPILDAPYFRQMALARLSLLRPDRKSFAIYSDANFAEFAGYSAFFWAAARFRDPAAQLLGDWMFRHDRARQHIAHASEWRSIEYYDPAIPAADWNSLPLFVNGGDFGAFCVRSSWQEDAAMMLFICGTFNGASTRKNFGNFLNNGHLLPQQGDVNLYIGSDIVLAPAEYPVPKLTRNHNVPLIADPGIEWRGQVNEGGTWFHDGKYKLADIQKEATLLEQRNSPEYSTYLADLGGIYLVENQPSPRNRFFPDFRRRVVFLPGGAVIVADRFRLPAERAIRFRLQTVAPAMADASGNDRSFTVNGRNYLIRDFSPLPFECSTTAETIAWHSSNKQRRTVYNLTTPPLKEAVFIAGAGKKELLEKIRVTGDADGFELTCEGKKYRFDFGR